MCTYFLDITFYSTVLADCSKMQICIHCHLCTCSLDYPAMIKIYSHFGVTKQLLWKFCHEVARQHCYSMLLMTPPLPLHQNTDKKENNANNNSRLAENVANASMVFASSKLRQSWDTINQTPTGERRAHGGAEDRKKSNRVTHFVSFCFRICTIRFPDRLRLVEAIWQRLWLSNKREEDSPGQILLSGNCFGI